MVDGASHTHAYAYTHAHILWFQSTHMILIRRWGAVRMSLSVTTEKCQRFNVLRWAVESVLARQVDASIFNSTEAVAPNLNHTKLLRFAFVCILVYFAVAWRVCEAIRQIRFKEHGFRQIYVRRTDYAQYYINGHIPAACFSATQ